MGPRRATGAPEVLEAPGGEPLRLDTDGDGTATPLVLTDPLPSGAPIVLLPRRLDVEVDRQRWHEVRLPVPPDGTRGWVAAGDVTVTPTDRSVRIRLAARRLEVFDEGRPVGSFEIAVGAPVTPTPVATYFVKELVAPSDPTGTYGPLAFGLAGYSEAIFDAAEFVDGVIGVHGTNHPELAGEAVGHGCIRLRSPDIEALGDDELPLGTPVVIGA